MTNLHMNDELLIGENATLWTAQPRETGAFVCYDHHEHGQKRPKHQAERQAQEDQINGVVLAQLVPGFTPTKEQYAQQGPQPNCCHLAEGQCDCPEVVPINLDDFFLVIVRSIRMDCHLVVVC